MKKTIIIIFSTFFFSDACEFWGIVAQFPPRALIHSHLTVFRSFSSSNPHGWGFGYFSDFIPRPVIIRGRQKALIDPRYTEGVIEFKDILSKGGIVHIRNASSGYTYIPNPHPFVRKSNRLEKYFLFAQSVNGRSTAKISNAPGCKGNRIRSYSRITLFEGI